MPFEIEPTDIIVIILVAIILFGPSKLPEFGRSLGKAISEFRLGIREMNQNFRQELKQPDFHRSAKDSFASRQVSESPLNSIKGNYCTSCGEPNPQGALYCSQCGQQILRSNSTLEN